VQRTAVAQPKPQGQNFPAIQTVNEMDEDMNISSKEVKPESNERRSLSPKRKNKLSRIIYHKP